MKCLDNNYIKGLDLVQQQQKKAMIAFDKKESEE